jgi:hypothetical protein
MRYEQRLNRMKENRVPRPLQRTDQSKNNQSLLDTMHASGSGGKGLKVVLLPPEES